MFLPDTGAWTLAVALPRSRPHPRLQRGTPEGPGKGGVARMGTNPGLCRLKPA